jgi:hypothetical protein
MDLYRTAFLQFLGGHLGELILVTGKAGNCTLYSCLLFLSSIPVLYSCPLILSSTPVLYSCPLFLSSIPFLYSCLPTSITVLGGSVFRIQLTNELLDPNPFPEYRLGNRIQVLRLPSNFEKYLNQTSSVIKTSWFSH